MVSDSCPGAGIKVDGGRARSPPENDCRHPPPAAEERRETLAPLGPEVEDPDCD
jgi:hypothetical protein